MELSLQVELKILAWKVKVLRWPARPSHNLFSYQTTTECGWHWNTPSTASPAVCVKMPGVRGVHKWHFAARILSESKLEGFVWLWHTVWRRKKKNPYFSWIISQASPPLSNRALKINTIVPGLCDSFHIFAFNISKWYRKHVNVRQELQLWWPFHFKWCN